MATLAARKSTHGEFRDVAEVAQRFKETARTGKNWSTLSDDKRESLDNMLHKFARILAGDPDHEDHWRDVGGYAKLSQDRLKK